MICRRWLGTAVVLLACIMAGAYQIQRQEWNSGSTPVLRQGFGGVLTWQNDISRDGQNLLETVLTPSAVQSGGFGPVFSYPVDGFIWGEPLYVPGVNVAGFGTKNVVYVTTANDSVYAFDADGIVSTPLWQTSFVNPSEGITALPASVINCPNGPEYGITATPTIDVLRGLIYVVGTIYNTNTGQAEFVLHALNLGNGQDASFSPIIVTSQVAGESISGLLLNTRPALLEANNDIYIAFASNCDTQPFNGFVLGYNSATLAQASAFAVTPSGKDGGIWMSGAGLSADSNGNIYFSTGNGTFDAYAGGPDYGDSFLRQNPHLSVTSYFTPYNQKQYELDDHDMGAGGNVLLPIQPGTYPHEVVTSSKDGTIYVLNRDSLGGYSRTGNNVIQQIAKGLPFGSFNGFAYWNGNIYAAGTGANLEQYPIINGLLGAQIVGRTRYPYPGATPSVSANGTTGGIVWSLINNSNAAELHASLATNVAEDLYDSGSTLSSKGVKFSVPMVANGRVYLGTQTDLVVFGLP